MHSFRFVESGTNSLGRW